LLFLVLLAEYRLFLRGLFASFGFSGLTLRLGRGVNSSYFFMGTIVFRDGFIGKYNILTLKTAGKIKF